MSPFERLVAAVVEKKLTESWYRISRYDDPSQAQHAIKNVARETAREVDHDLMTVGLFL